VRAIDSSAIVKYLSREPGWERVREVMEEGILTLNLAVIEIANALWKKVVKNGMGLEEVQKIMKAIVEAKFIPLEPFEGYLIDALRIAVEHKVTVYDALFIAFALKRGLELVTADEKQAEVAKALGVKIVLV
jgi:predicted nucleic acid-binding protein